MTGMRAAFLTGHGGNEVVAIGERPIPVRGPDEALVRIRGAGLNRVDLYMRDSGAGMSPAEVERLGEPFFQAGDAERRARGSGLGLAVVRALVKLHDGAFEVTSSVGGGTTVTISLPVRRSSGVVSPFARAITDEAGRKDNEGRRIA